MICSYTFHILLLFSPFICNFLLIIHCSLFHILFSFYYTLQYNHIFSLFIHLFLSCSIYCICCIYYLLILTIEHFYFNFKCAIVISQTCFSLQIFPFIYILVKYINQFYIYIKFHSNKSFHITITKQYI